MSSEMAKMVDSGMGGETSASLRASKMSLRQALRVFSPRTVKSGGAEAAGGGADAAGVACFDAEDADADAAVAVVADADAGVAGLALPEGDWPTGVDEAAPPAFGVVATLPALLPPLLLLAAVLDPPPAPPLPPLLARSLSMTAFQPWTSAFALVAISAWGEARNFPTIWPILVVCARHGRQERCDAVRQDVMR